MPDIRLKVLPFTLDGRVYLLRCNFNVLADVQAACGGDLLSLLNSPANLATVREFLPAMLNDYADEMGWPERFTARQLGRMLNFSALPLADIAELIRDGITGGTEDTTEKN